MTIRTGQWAPLPRQHGRFRAQAGVRLLPASGPRRAAQPVVSAAHMIVDEHRKRPRVPVGLPRRLRIGQHLARIVRQLASEPGSVGKELVQAEQVGAAQRVQQRINGAEPVRQAFLLKIVELERCPAEETAGDRGGTAFAPQKTLIGRYGRERGILPVDQTQRGHAGLAQARGRTIGKSHDLVVEIGRPEHDLRTARRERAEKVPRYFTKRSVGDRVYGCPRRLFLRSVEYGLRSRGQKARARCIGLKVDMPRNNSLP